MKTGQNGSMPKAITPNDPLEIVVLGYPPRFVAAVRRLLGIEGGYSNDPVDRGGATQYGISLRFLKAEGGIDLDGDGLADFDLDMDGDIDGADVRLLAKANAIFLYYRCFWQRYALNDFAAPLGEAMFDQAVNGGGASARRLLQKAINRCLFKPAAFSSDRPAMLTEDGVIGAQTRTALDWVLKRPALGMPALIVAYREAAADRYRAIAAADPKQARFLKGWLRRAADLGRLS